MKLDKIPRDQADDTPQFGNINPGGDHIQAEGAISEDDAVKAAEKRLDGLTKLLAIPVPLISAVMIALATGTGPIKVIGLEIPRNYAEYAARITLMLIFVQCCSHLLVLVLITRQQSTSEKLRRALAWHPGPLNPFFTRLYSVGAFFRYTLFLGQGARVAVGFIVGFSQGFRLDYSSGLVSHWYRLGSLIVWPFSREISATWSRQASEIVKYYIASNYLSQLFDTIVAIFFLFVSFGMGCAIISVVASIAGRTSDLPTVAALQLISGGISGLVIAIVVSNALKMAIAAAP